MKCFISVPMGGRTDEQIIDSLNRLQDMAKIVFGEDTEFIDNFITEPIPAAYLSKKPNLWYIGEAIKKMADADCIMSPGYITMYEGCKIELEIARSSGIKVFEYDACLMFEDVREALDKHYMIPVTVDVADVIKKVDFDPEEYGLD